MQKQETDSGLRKPAGKVVRLLLLIGGLLSAIAGFAGIFIPLLPTTPFLLLASWCFVRSSDRMNRLLLGNKYLGPYIANYRMRRGITRRNKIYSLSFLYLTISVSVIFGPDYWWLKAGLLLLAVVITIHILRFKTLEG
ncbi:MAG: YbaN family protein [Bacteroidales bacterium]|nr:YbaN family protein [Bacteroidales bacterium]